MPRPYDLRHSFADLLLHEGRQSLYVAKQLGHSVAVLHSTYAHIIDEYEEAPDIDVNAEIAKARGNSAGTSQARQALPAVLRKTV